MNLSVTNTAIKENFEEEWLKVLGKGMVTLPKKWRDELQITSGDMVKAKKAGKNIVIEAMQAKRAPYRIYSEAEIGEFLNEDVLPPELKLKVDKHLAKISGT